MISVRLQRKRTKDWKMVSPNELPVVYVGRGSRWGNPHKMSDYDYPSEYFNRHASIMVWRRDLSCVIEDC